MYVKSKPLIYSIDKKLFIFFGVINWICNFEKNGLIRKYADKTEQKLKQKTKHGQGILSYLDVISILSIVPNIINDEKVK